MKQLQKQIKMKKVFKIFKEGKTIEWVTILMPEKKCTNENIIKKINFYQYLGYKIELINN